MKKVNPEWKKEILESIDRDRKENRDVKLDKLTTYTPAIQWLIATLSKMEIPFRLINLGAGVKKITTDTSTCPKCNGTGKC